MNNIEKALETQILALSMVYGVVKVAKVITGFVAGKPKKEEETTISD